MRSSYGYLLFFCFIIFLVPTSSNEVFGKIKSIDNDIFQEAHELNEDNTSSFDLIQTEDVTPAYPPLKQRRKIFLLSLDGGAIRGIIHAHVLAHLEKLLNLPIVKIFSGISGASTGAIVALGVGIPNPELPGYPLYSAEEIQNMYLTERNHIFEKQSLSKRLKAGDGAFKPKYAATGIEKSLERYYKNHQLSDLLVPTSVPATEISEGKGATILSSLKARKNKSRDYLLEDIARATSAAPGFFESKEIIKDATGEDTETILNFWDGGMFANNPSEIVLMEAQKAFPHAKLEDFVILSIGTGEKKIKINHEKSQQLGYINGGHKMMRTLLSAQKSWVDKKLKSMLGKNYIRMQVDLGEVALKHDDISLEYLEALYFASEQMLEESRDKIMHLKDLWESQGSKKKSAYENFSELQLLISKKDSVPLKNKQAFHAIYEDYCREHKLNPKKDRNVGKMIRHIKKQVSSSH